MPIPLGILAAAGRSQAPAGAFQLLESTVLTGSQASVSFTNLVTKYAATYQHLQLRMVVRDTAAFSEVEMRMQFSGDTSTNYRTHIMFGNGSSVNAFAPATSTQIDMSSVGSSFTGSAFAAHVVDILDPFETTKNKTVKMLRGYPSSGFSRVALASGVQFSTSAISSINIAAQSNHDIGSRFSLYGIKATA